MSLSLCLKFSLVKYNFSDIKTIFYGENSVDVFFTFFYINKVIPVTLTNLIKCCKHFLKHFQYWLLPQTTVTLDD